MKLVTMLLRMKMGAKKADVRPSTIILVVVMIWCVEAVRLAEDIFENDVLTPYLIGSHGSTRTTRDIEQCQHANWSNRTFEHHKISIVPPENSKVSYRLEKFADVVHSTPLRKRYAVGTIAFVDDPYFTLSVMEPGRKGGCEMSPFLGIKSTVQDTAAKRKDGCVLAANAGYFGVTNGACYGNVIADGRLVQSANGVPNANFGIRRDGTIVVGYISDEEIRDTENPFRQLVAGVVWLVRNGTNYVNESKVLECSEHEDTGSMDTFINVISARTAVGHDKDGRLVMAQIEGQTHNRGANLNEFADLLIRKGVVNAINLDGGGSNTLVEKGVLINYPSDHCNYNGMYRCPRDVSTILCVHDVQCLEPDCSGHGTCDHGTCTCDKPWVGGACDTLNCSIVDCNGRGNCTNGKCDCESGYTGDYCNETCPANRYGPNCAKTCYCYGKSLCDSVKGGCVCPPGYAGYGCLSECSEGYYGVNCQYSCNCSDHGVCSKINGTCACDKGWRGSSCDISYNETDDAPPYGVSMTDESAITSTMLPSLSQPPPSTLSPLITLSQTHLLPVTLQVAPPTVSSTSGGSDNNYSNITCDNKSPSFSTPTTVILVTVMVALGTLLLHIVICVISRKGDAPLTREEIKRELRNRRDWEKLSVDVVDGDSSDTDVS